VELEEKCWSLFLLFIFCPPALPQAVTVAGGGNNGSADISWTMEQETIAPLQLATDGQAPSPPPQTSGTPAQNLMAGISPFIPRSLGSPSSVPALLFPPLRANR
jgi:hypothetical protein